jgi:hypothetical protein
MKRNRLKKDRAKGLPSVEENLSVQAADEDTPQVTIDIEQAWEEMRSLLEVNDE